MTLLELFKALEDESIFPKERKAQDFTVKVDGWDISEVNRTDTDEIVIQTSKAEEETQKLLTLWSLYQKEEPRGDAETSTYVEKFGDYLIERTYEKQLQEDATADAEKQ
jgi:hypothetical protein